jgi:hypothetical protein
MTSYSLDTDTITKLLKKLFPGLALQNLRATARLGD